MAVFPVSPGPRQLSRMLRLLLAAYATWAQASRKAKLATLDPMQISELAHRTGVSVHALRHYERLGLLTPTRRASGYREYAEAMRREVIFIAMSRKMGFSLKAIAEQLPAYRAGQLTFTQMVLAMQARVAERAAACAKR